MPRGMMKQGLITTGLLALGGVTGYAQTSVTTQHYDIARTGANTNETILTPSNINTNTFGRLFSQPVDGYVYAQPLYMAGVTMGPGAPQAGTTHNVVFVATEHDSVFAFDADNSNGVNASPLWQVSLLGAGETTVLSADVFNDDITPEIGITSTPVIDPSSNTIYVVAKSTVAHTTFIQRLHALDITTGQEKFGGPVELSASVPGNGNGSSGGTLNWDPLWQNNRASLLLLNGIIYLGFGSHGDIGPWHGWILAYSASTLSQTGAWSSTPNAAGAGIWMGGTGLAADVPSGKPYGRIFTATGNGTFDAVAPNYTNAMDYGDSIIKLDLNNGVPTMVSNGTTVGDDFTPHNQDALNNTDGDPASGGVVLLPSDQLVQVGKSGTVYVLNRENLGGYNPNNTTDPGEAAYNEQLWGAPAYWNGNVYIWALNSPLNAFSFANGALSSTPTSSSNETAGQYSPSPSVSANGTTNGIVWSMKTDNYASQGRAVLYAHDATNVANLLYSSESNVTRDNPGNSVKFVVPTVINGKVYVGTESQLSVYGLLNGETQAATPVISPASESFQPSVQVTLTDTTAGATIYYTTDGSTPTTASTQYTGPFSITTTTTVNAIAAGSGLLASSVASATYTLTTQVVAPVFNPPPASYAAVQSVTISTTTSNTSIYYTLDGTTPTKNSARYMGPVSVGVTETLSAIAVDNNGVLSNSPVTSGLYTIDLGGVSSINLSTGFTAGSMELLGSAKLNGTVLELTDGGGGEAAAAWYQYEANIQAFTTDFNFQITPGSSSTADGFTFAIQGNNETSIGPSGGGLGYGPDSTAGTPGIANSVAVKFDLANNEGEGNDSTGLYTNGASPTVPAVDMTSSGVNLHSGDVFHVHMTYDGTTLTLTITDTTTNATFTTSWVVNIPRIVGGNVAYVGFTAGTGESTATQEILNWTLTSTGTPVITSATTASGTVGTAFTYQISATSSPTSYGATGLPAGLSVNSSTGLISGTPTGAGTSSVTLSATNGTGTGNATLTLTISVAAPVITSATTVSGTVGTAFTYQISATSSPTSYGAMGLPAGLSVNSSTGLISGITTGAGTSSVTLSATNATGTGKATLALTISVAAPVITSLNPSAGPVGATVTITGKNFGSTQGTSAVTFNGTPATVANSNWSGTSITTTVPSGATTGNVLVTVDGVASNGVSFTGQDFSIATTSPSRVTVTAGQTASYALAVVPVGGFNQTVALTCSDAATLSVCKVSPSSVLLNGTSSTPVTVTIATTAPVNGVLPLFRNGPSNIKSAPLAFTGVAIGLMAVISLLLWWPKKRFPWTPAIATTVLLAATMLVSSCASVPHPSTTGGGSPGTPAGSYTISISSTFTSGSTALTHSTSLTLIVQ